MVKVLDPNIDFLTRLRAAHPEVFIIGRIVVPLHEQERFALDPDGDRVATVNLYSTETIATYPVTVWPATIDGLMRVASQSIQRDPPLLASAERHRFGKD